VLDGTWGPWVIEVKTGRINSVDLAGLHEFTRRHPKYRPLVLCDPLQRLAAERADVTAMDWAEFLRAGPPGV